MKALSDAVTYSRRKEILAFAAERYGTNPEYLWRNAPNYAVLRHTGSRKWYGLIMDVPKAHLGLPGGGKADILNIKCDPLLAGSLRRERGFLPAYHMNRENWVSVLLDGTVETAQVCALLEMSYKLTSARPKKSRTDAAAGRGWIVPDNPRYYDLERALLESDSILWKQSSRVLVGETVYLYVAAPVSAIRYRCQAVEVGIPYRYDDANLHIEQVMRLKCLQRYDPAQFTLDVLKGYGVTALRGPRRVPNALAHALEDGVQPCPASAVQPQDA